MTQNKITQLTNFLRYKGVFASHDCAEWGARAFYNEPNRLKRKLIERAVIKELNPVQLKAIGKQDSVEKYYYYSGAFKLLNNKMKYKSIGIEI